jgi:predicted branched-subunit amino acid permease
MKKEYFLGLKAGIPVGLGYFSVSFAFGVAAVQGGLSILQAVIISLTNLTSAGQVAGLSIILSAGTLIEMAATQFIINLRYALMSISLSQKLDKSVTLLDRMILSFGVTDENFAIAVNRGRSVTAPYFFGLMTLPILCWTGGTFFGAAAGSILPASILSALGVAIYGMFVAIVLPVAKKSLSVALVTLLAILLSCAFAWVPGLNAVSSGFAIIISAIVAALVGALFFPREEVEE